MHKIRLLILLSALVSAPVLAHDLSMDNNASKDCALIAKSCIAAGFVRKDIPGKRFWQDCMHRIILGKSVAKVSIDPARGEACRLDKIKELKAELDDLQQK